MPRADVEAAAGFVGSFSGHERNVLFEQTEAGWTEAAHAYGLDFDGDGRAVAPIDFDGDGDLDLALLELDGLRVLENRSSGAAHFARVELRANTPAGALGARVRVEAGGRAWIDQVQLTAGLQTQISPVLHFGLGDAAAIDRLEVEWPAGGVTVCEALAVDQRVEIGEGGEGCTLAPIPRWPAREAPALRSAVGIPPAEDAEGRELAVFEAGQATVLNLWAPWCEACEDEAPALAKLAAELGEDLRVVGVSVEREDVDSVEAFVRRHRLPYTIAYATEPLLEHLLGRASELRLPATFVFDGEGQLRRAFYRGVEADEIRAALDGAAPRSTVVLRELAAAHVELDNWTAAQAALEQVVEQAPDDAEAWLLLAKAELALSRVEAASAAAERALALNPQDDRAWQIEGAAAWARGDLDAAVVALDRGYAINPNSTDILMTRAVIAQAHRDAATATVNLERAIAIEPGRPDAYLLLLGLLDAQANKQAELAELRREFERKFPHLVGQ